MLAYSHGATDLLGVQIDAAINSGNSGGPVFDDSGLCVGVAFQVLRGGGPDHMDQPEAIGYVIPVPVIQHLLDDVARNGGYTGFPSLGCEWQKLENASLRKSLGLDSAQKGVLVRRMEPTAPSSAVMSGGDVLLSIDDQPSAFIRWPDTRGSSIIKPKLSWRAPSQSRATAPCPSAAGSACASQTPVCYGACINP